MHDWITKVARDVVVQRLMRDKCGQNVKVGPSSHIGGGLQSDAVLQLRVDVHLVAKIAGPELNDHKRYLDAINRLLPRLFPEVLAIVHIDGTGYVLLMEELLEKRSALSLVFGSRIKIADALQLIRHTIRVLNNLHAIAPSKIPKELRSREIADPYTSRLRTKLGDITRLDPALEQIWKVPCIVFGQECPPLESVLHNIETWLASERLKVKPTLLHGDPHLGNIFCAVASKPIVRFIDPNPDACFGDPIYDFGKLLHWIEPVGWAAYNPAVCLSRWEPSRRHGKARLNCYLSSKASPITERRRARIEEFFRQTFHAEYKGHGARLAVAVATAHVGLARLLAQQRNLRAARFVLAYVLQALHTWETHQESER